MTRLVLDLFAGSRSVSKVARGLGFDTFSVDNTQWGNIDLITDIQAVQPEWLPPCPDFIFASPPCQSYSRVGYRFHREKGTGKPKTADAVKGEKLVLATLRLIRHFLDANPSLIYYIENPEGHLARSAIHTESTPGLLMAGVPMTKVTYCSYGDIHLKPTNIWTNNLRSALNPRGWQPRPVCRKGNPNCQHVRSPTGTTTLPGIKHRGIESLPSLGLRRAVVPPGLIEEMLGCEAPSGSEIVFTRDFVTKLWGAKYMIGSTQKGFISPRYSSKVAAREAMQLLVDRNSRSAQ